MVQVGNHLNPMDFREWQGIFSVNHGVSLHPPPWFVHGGLNLAAWIFTKKPKGNHPDGARRSLDHPVRRRRHSRDSPGAPWGAAGSGASAKCRGRPSTKRRSVGKRTKSWRKKKRLTRSGSCSFKENFMHSPKTKRMKADTCPFPQRSSVPNPHSGSLAKPGPPIPAEVSYA